MKFVFCLSISFGLSAITFAQQHTLNSSVSEVSNVNVGKNAIGKTASPNLNIPSKTNVASVEELSKEGSVVLVNKTAPKGVNVNFLPLFGGFTKTEAQLIEDQMFISDCDKSFATRKEAAEFFIKMGWQYLEEGDKNQAINRFNYASLLSENNLEVFWGLGVIEYQTGNFSNSVKLLNLGLESSKGTNHVLMVDLATIYIQMAINNPNSLFEITKAKELLDKAIKLQPSYTTAFMQLCLVQIIENNLDGAWESFHKGFNISPSEINQDILAELLKKKPDPAGIFK